MSQPYTYIENDGTRTIIRPSAAEPETVWLSLESDDQKVGALIPNADVPTVAAELLKAAGRSELAEMLEAVEAERTARVEREAAEKKLQERRDAVALEIMRNDDDLPLSDYASLPWYTKKAVDIIIELATKLEDGK